MASSARNAAPSGSFYSNSNQTPISRNLTIGCDCRINPPPFDIYPLPARNSATLGLPFSPYTGNPPRPCCTNTNALVGPNTVLRCLKLRTNGTQCPNFVCDPCHRRNLANLFVVRDSCLLGLCDTHIAEVTAIGPPPTNQSLLLPPGTQPPYRGTSDCQPRCIGYDGHAGRRRICEECTIGEIRTYHAQSTAEIQARRSFKYLRSGQSASGGGRYNLRARPARRGKNPSSAASEQVQGPSAINDSGIHYWKLERIMPNHPLGPGFRKQPIKPYCWCGRKANHKRSGVAKRVRMCAICFDRGGIPRRADGTVDEMPSGQPWVPTGYVYRG